MSSANEAIEKDAWRTVPISLLGSSGAEPERLDECSDQNHLPKPYEPPRIERLGNLRELLAKTGVRPDAPPPHPVRP